MDTPIAKFTGTLRRADKRILLTTAAFLLIAAASLLVFGFWQSERSELRGALPETSLAFLEIRDVGAVYGLILNNASDSKREAPGFLDGVEAAIAITGFEATEQTLTGSSSILNIRPTFAAVAETNAWSWQISGLIDGPLNDFIREQYGQGTKLSEETGKFGRLQVWTAPDGRKSYAATEGSRIIFGNDLSAIESCRSASSGDIPSLLEDKDLDEFYSSNPDSQIIGYFPRRAIENFADVAGVSAAVSGSEQEGVRSFIARLVPQVLKNGVQSVTWTSRNRAGYFEDDIQINTQDDVSEVFAETMKPAEGDWERIVELLPGDTVSLTRYRLRDPLLAYRSLILTSAKSADPVSGRLIAAFSDSMLQPYGVSDAEAFLATVGPEMVTFQTGRDEDASAAIATVKDRDGLVKVLSRSIGTVVESAGVNGVDIWISEDKQVAAAIVSNILVLGERRVVLDSLEGSGTPSKFAGTREFDTLSKTAASAATVSPESREYKFADPKGAARRALYFSATTFSKTGITRRYESRFGLIGTVLDGIGNQ